MLLFNYSNPLSFDELFLEIQTIKKQIQTGAAFRSLLVSSLIYRMKSVMLDLDPRIHMVPPLLLTLRPPILQSA